MRERFRPNLDLASKRLQSTCVRGRHTQLTPKAFGAGHFPAGVEQAEGRPDIQRDALARRS